MAIITVITLLILATTTAAEQTVLYSGCSSETFLPNLAFSTTLQSLITAITNSAATSPYNHFNQDGAVQGVYQCRGDLSQDACSSCVSEAVSQMTATCPTSTSGHVMLQRCYVKYDVTSFLGVEDKRLVLKKCGNPVGPDNSNAVGPLLDGLETGGPYRNVVSGSERGLTQCLGDLTADQCTDCVDSALSLVKTECGSSDSGDVFLVKCYARFTLDSKTLGSASGHGIKSPKIIADVLVAVVILILLLTFLYKAFSRRRKQSAPAPAPPAPPAPATHSPAHSDTSSISDSHIP